MPTNEERREVADRLRILAGHREVDKELVEDTLGLYMGECVDGYDPVSVSELACLIDPEPERTCENESSKPLKEIRYGYVSRVSGNSWLPSGDPLTAEIEVEGAIDLRLSIDNDKAADWYGKRVKMTIELDSE